MKCQSSSVRNEGIRQEIGAMRKNRTASDYELEGVFIVGEKEEQGGGERTEEAH